MTGAADASVGGRGCAPHPSQTAKRGGRVSQVGNVCEKMSLCAGSN